MADSATISTAGLCRQLTGRQATPLRGDFRGRFEDGEAVEIDDLDYH